MLYSLGLIFLIGLFMAFLFEKLKLPRIIGMLITGIILGQYVLNLLDVSILNISSELRQIALIIILIKAGLALNLSDLKKVGRPAIMMAFIPACFEIIGYIIFAPIFFGMNFTESALMGTVLSAVSPAVVVPRMINLIEKNYGTNKSIPQMILAGASCDDVFVIVLFSTFLTMAQGGSANMINFIYIPVSVILGILLGIIAGLLLYFLFENFYQKYHKIRNTMKLIIMLAVAFLLVTLESKLKNYISISGLLAVVAMACCIKKKSELIISNRLSEKFGKLWIGAELILFVLVGAEVNISYTLTAGISAIGIILIALVFRTIGVCICMTGTNLNKKEKLFCVIAYLPKATVQAGIGSVPFALGLPCGKIILSVAVVAILITAPLGALGIDNNYQKLLSKLNAIN
ncbi:MAG: cation:proton antiporter [Oscillospiraceae bacterium]|nr:cation:proton antiporter [Oscillospiraceae bacterium]